MEVDIHVISGGRISLVFGWGGRCRTSTLKFKGGALILFNDTTINNFMGGILAEGKPLDLCIL